MKSKFVSKIIILILVLILGVHSVQSQTDSLIYYQNLAMKANPAVLQRYNQYLASLEKVPQVGSLPDPQLEMGVYLTPMELMAGNQVADIKLMQMFPWFGVLKNAKDEMNYMAKANYELFRDAGFQVCFDVKKTAIEMQKSRKQIQLSEKNLELLKTIQQLAIVKFKTGGSSSGSVSNKTTATIQNSTTGSNAMSGGMGNASAGSSTPTTQMASAGSMSSTAAGTGLIDLYNIQLEINELENTIASLKDKQTTLQARFNSYLNRPAQLLVSVGDSIKAEVSELELVNQHDSAFAQNPMLVMLKYEQKSLTSRKIMQKQMGLPMVGVGLNYSIISKAEMSTSPMNGQDMLMPMLTVTLPIYRKKYNAMQKETNYLKTASELNYQQTSNALQNEFSEAKQMFFDARRRIQFYEVQSKLGQQSLGILIKSFSASATGLSDLMRKRQQLLDYEFKHVDAISDFNTAIAWMNRLKTTSVSSIDKP